MKVYTEAEVEEKLSNQKKEYEAIIRKLKDESNHEDLKKKRKLNNGSAVGEVQKIPPILSMEFRYILLTLVQFMDVLTFSRFIRSSKVIYTLAKNGFLKKNVQLMCKGWQLWDSGMINMTCLFTLHYGQKLIEHYQYYALSVSPYFYFELEILNIDRINFYENEAILTRLLEHTNIKRIRDMKIGALSNLDRFFEKFNVEKLKTVLYDMAHLNQQALYKIQDVNITCYFHHRDAAQEIMRFLESSTAVNIEFSGRPIPNVFAWELVKKWLCGEKRFGYIRLDLENRETVLDPGYFGMTNGVREIRRNFRYITVDYVEKNLTANASMIYLGCRDSYIFVNESKKMLMVYFNRVHDKSIVTMEAI